MYIVVKFRVIIATVGLVTNDRNPFPTVSSFRGYAVRITRRLTSRTNRARVLVPDWDYLGIPLATCQR